MNRVSAIQQIEQYFDQDEFFFELSRRVKVRTESQIPDQQVNLFKYLEDEIAASLVDLGFRYTIEQNPIEGGGPVLIAERVEDPSGSLAGFTATLQCNFTRRVKAQHKNNCYKMSLKNVGANQ